MGTTFGFNGLELNTGSYYGGGYTSSASGSYAGNGYRVASSSNINRVSRDIAQGYSQSIEVIDLYLQQGNVNQALALYDSLFDEVKQTANGYGYELTDGQIASILNNAYARETGNSFVASVNEECHSPFVTGLIEGIPIIGCFTNGNSDAEAVSKATGTQTRTIDKAGEVAGAILTNAGAYAAIGTAIGGWAFGAGTIIGGIIGAGVGIAKCLIKGK